MSSNGPVRVDLLLETGGGGSGRHVLDLFAGLRERGWDAHLVLSARRMDAAFAAEVNAIPERHVTFIDLRRAPHPTDISAVALMKRNISRVAVPYLLHAHSTKAGIIGWALGRTCACRILTPHAYRGMDPGLTRARGGIIRRAEALFSRSFDAVIAVSEGERQYTAALGISAGRLYCVGNGVNSGRIRAVAQQVRSQRCACGPVLGFVGRLVCQKNADLFLRVLRLLVERGIDATGLIIGDGPQMLELKMKAVAWNIADRIQWRGSVAAIAELGKMDVLVHTSAYESSPYALLEAVAAEVPVVAVDNTGSRSIFGELLPEAIVQDGSVGSLGDAVEDLLKSECVQRRYNTQYRCISARFSADRMVEKTIGIYKRALGNYSL